MSEPATNSIAEWEDYAGRLANHIQKIRIDFPEAADARRADLHEVYRKIALLRRAPSPLPPEGSGI